VKRSMLLLILSAAAGLLATPVEAARKPCEELREEIATRIDAKGVTSYSLQIVAPEDVASGRVVGSCDGGTRRIVYARGAVARADSAPLVAKADQGSAL
jgi:hypothetical protein